MNKKDLEKVLVADGVLAPKDLAADEKKRLYALMNESGASEAFAYTRFFRDGFAEWELQGIRKARTEYLRQLQAQEHLDIDVCSFDTAAPGDFWRFLGDIRKRIHFGEYMATLGMKSQTTVAKRFAVDDWREFELLGVRQIVSTFIEHAE